MNSQSQSKVILDTNTWLDWLLFNDVSVAAIRQRCAEKSIQLVATARMRDELADVLGRPQFAKHFAQTRQLHHLLAEFDALVQVVPPPEPIASNTPIAANSAKVALKAQLHPLTCKDPDDQIFIDLALASSPCVLVSKDKLVLAVAKRLKKWLAAQGAENRPIVFICRPSEFATLPL
jgi:putative PIN family toxin of toxin-antitoxin system